MARFILIIPAAKYLHFILYAGKAFLIISLGGFAAARNIETRRCHASLDIISETSNMPSLIYFSLYLDIILFSRWQIMLSDISIMPGREAL